MFGVYKAIDFGDSTDTNGFSKTSCSSSTRGIIAGGYTQPSNVNVNTIEYVEISTLGNGQDFGDLSFTGQNMMALSDSHGGLGGF